jgi:hypothetical protein
LAVDYIYIRTVATERGAAARGDRQQAAASEHEAAVKGGLQRAAWSSSIN